MAMQSKKGDALLMLLAKPKHSDGEDSSSSSDDDLKSALEDLASALGCKVTDAQKGIEALKAIDEILETSEGSEEE